MKPHRYFNNFRPETAIWEWCTPLSGKLFFFTFVGSEVFFPSSGYTLLTALTDGREAGRNAAVWKVHENRMRTEERKVGGT